MIAAELSAIYDIDINPLKRGLDTADRKMDEHGRKATRAGDAGFNAAGKAGGGFLALAGKVGGVALGVGALLGGFEAVKMAAGFLWDSVGAASDLGESVNAVNVTFGDAADGVKKLGEEAATAVGLSNKEFNGLAVQFSAFATQIAGPGGDVVKTLQELTVRGADFASVMNLDVNEAMGLFQSGLAGETEPLRKYGLDLSAAAVEAYAMANGIGTADQALTEQEKVLARYGLLMAGTAKSQGDFANTSDSMANQQRILKAEFENTKAELGTALMPIVQDFMSLLLNEGVPALKDLAAWVTENKDGIREFAFVLADMIIAGVEGFLRFSAAALSFNSTMAGALRSAWVAFSSFVQFLLDGAAKAFSWVPGIGPKLQGAAREFDIMSSTASAKLGAMEIGARNMAGGLDKAADTVAGLRDRIGELRDKTVNVNVKYTKSGDLSTVVRGTDLMVATGGYIAGPGTGTSDSIPAWLSNGEYVIKAAAVAKYGRAMFDQLNAGRFSGGGPVNAPSAPVASMSMGGGGPLVHADTINVIEGTPDDVANRLAFEARTRGW